ncbi:MAG TPA: dihydrofolate reductase family protein [Acidimicrobiales bacterium]|nr:dihydrofolate reductase family protein [Acidimicrobiales bacterium]
MRPPIGTVDPAHPETLRRLTTVAKLVYSAITSLDGYTADDDGQFDWAAPDPEVHAFINDLERCVGTYLYGRRMYETMLYWETFEAHDDQPSCVRDFAALWRAADKVVYSTTRGAVSSARTRIERDFEPAAVQRMKQAAGRDLSVGGPGLASHAMAAGLVDELHLFLTPVTVGGGTPALPDDLRSHLDLLQVDRFASGVVHLHYRFRGHDPGRPLHGTGEVLQ